MQHRDVAPAQIADDDIEQCRYVARFVLAELELLRPELDRALGVVDLERGIGDAVQLTQVFVNLIINAKLVMEEGGTIEIKGGVIDKQIWATNQDQGPGITAELRTRVFEPFFSTRSEKGGSGLGLAISRAVVETHGGSLVLETTAPQPARFRIVLPAQQADTPALDAVTA